MHSSRLNEFLSGVRDEAPILIGVAPFGMIYGVIAVNAGLSTLAAQSMSSIPRIPAAAVAIFIALRWRSTIFAIAAGMIIFWLLRAAA